jgi:L-gulonolactone oxidase
MIVASYLRVGVHTTFNILVNAATAGRTLWLEGRVRGGTFRNWARGFRYRPARVVRPRTEDEIVDLVKKARKVRAYGSGHSFNAGVVTDDVLLSLDQYSGAVSFDAARRRLVVKGGTRVREVVRLLAAEGLAFPALPSHDAQSIAGVLATDVHGTGRDWGFVSSSVTGLKIVDGRGEVHECEPGEELFRAAVGGVGAVGLITEVTVEAVSRFCVEQRTTMVDTAWVERNLDSILSGNDHASLYFFPFADRCQLNTWNRTDRRPTLAGPLREWLSTSFDALLSAWLGGLLAYSHQLPRARLWSRLAYLVRQGTNVVLDSPQAFNRSIYHLHQELEFTVPYEDTVQVSRRLLRLYEELSSSGLPYTVLEVRFTPAGHEQSLLGPGRTRRSAWMDVLCNDSDGFTTYYAAVEELVRELGGRPHLGKYSHSLGADDLRRLYGDDFDRFRAIMAERDPEKKFSNDFTRRLFGPT